MLFFSRSQTRIGLFVLCSCVLGTPLVAQRTLFEPRLALRSIYRSNVDFVGEDEVSDSSLRLSLALPVTRTLKKGTLDFAYAGYAEAFNAVTEFDNIGHSVGANLNVSPGVFSNLSMGARYSRTQDQGGSNLELGEIDEDPTFTPRLERDGYSVDLSYDRRFGKNWVGGLELQGRRDEYRNAVDSEEDERGGEDKDLAGVSVTFGRRVGRYTSIGLSVDAWRFDLEFTGETNYLGTSFVVDRIVEQRSALNLSLGGYRREVGESPLDEIPVEVTDDETLEFYGKLQYTRYLRRISYTIAGQHRPSAGGARLGTATVSDLRLELFETLKLRTDLKRWTWKLFARWGRRDPDLPFQATIETLEGGGGIYFVVVKKIFGVSLVGSYVDQAGDDFSTTSFYRAALSLDWHPFGWKKWSEGFNL